MPYFFQWGKSASQVLVLSWTCLKHCWITALLGTWFAGARTGGVEVTWSQRYPWADPSGKQLYRKTSQGSEGIRPQAVALLGAPLLKSRWEQWPQQGAEGCACGSTVLPSPSLLCPQMSHGLSWEPILFPRRCREGWAGSSGMAQWVTGVLLL